MSRDVLISIRPKWCALIASGKKTIEIRKTRPNIMTPFKCYMYCTKPKYDHEDFIVVNAGSEEAFAFYGGGMVIGKFVCDRIFPIACEDPGPFSEERGDGYDEKYSSLGYNDCLTDEEYDTYLNGKPGYGWHISGLKIYDQPKKLSEFRKPIEDLLGWNCEIERPPQNWCYVEEVSN